MYGVLPPNPTPCSYIQATQEVRLLTYMELKDQGHVAYYQPASRQASSSCYFGMNIRDS